MSRQQALRDALGERVRGVVVQKDVVQHGEPGALTTVRGHGGKQIKIFLADDRVVDEAHYVAIMRSHLGRIGLVDHDPSPCDLSVLGMENGECPGVDAHCARGEHCTATGADCSTALSGRDHAARCCLCGSPL